MNDDTGLIDDEEERSLFQEETAIDKPKKLDFFAAADAIDDEVTDNKQSQLKSSMYYASQKNPDAHAKDLKTAKIAQMPVQAATANPQMAEQKAKFKSFMEAAEDVDEEYSQTGKLLSDKDTAAVIQDDVGTFHTLEDIWKTAMAGDFTEAGIKGLAAVYMSGKEKVDFTEDKLIRAPSASIINMVGAIPSNMGYLWDEASFKSAQLLDLVTPDAYNKHIYTQDDNPEYLKTLNKYSDYVSIGRVGKDSGAAIRSFAEVVDVPRERKDWITDMTGAMGQIAGMVIVAGLSGPTAASTLMFSQGADMQRQAMESEGVRPTIPNMLVGGAITMATERWGINQLMNRLPTPIRNKFLSVLTDVSKAATMEMFEEFVEGLAHNTVEYLTFNDEVDFSEGLLEEMRTAGSAAAAFRLIIQTLGSKRGKLNLADYSREQEQIDGIIKAAEESISKDRDPSIVREHIENLIDNYGHSENIYIPADAAAEAFNELSLDQSIPEIKAVFDQLPEALNVGGDIVIPTQDFVSYFTESATVEKIRRHIRLSPDTLSEAEMELIKEDDRASLQESLEKALADQKLKTEADKVTDEIADQLIKTGRMGSVNARLNAKILSSYVATKASRESREISEVFESLGIKIQGAKFKEPESTTSGLSYTQDFGDIVFKDQKIHSVSGKKINIEQSGQRTWDQNVKRRKQVLKVKDCING